MVGYEGGRASKVTSSGVLIATCERSQQDPFVTIRMSIPSSRATEPDPAGICFGHSEDEGSHAWPTSPTHKSPT